jgi:DNA repair exonuclease SbcCD nuclease subunit
MTFKVAAIGDTHISLSSRWDEGSRILDAFVAEITERRVDLVIHTGDVFDKLSRPHERLRFARFVQDCAQVAPVVIVRGNHDAPADLAIFDGQFLRTAHTVIVEETAKVHDVGEFLVAGVAWPKKAWLLAENSDVDERAALQGILTGVSDWKAPASEAIPIAADEPRKPRILAMHGMVTGAKTSLGQPLVGCDMEVALSDLALARADVVLLGHIHLPQDCGTVNGAPVLYTGSSRRTAYGEVEDKGFVLVEFERVGSGDEKRWQANCTRIQLPATPMLLLDADYTSNALALDAPEAHRDIVGADVRLRYRCTTETREAARSAAERMRDEMTSNGAANVVIDEQLTVVSTARVPEITRAATLPDKLRMLRTARGETLDAPTEARLNEKLIELEGLSR